MLLLATAKVHSTLRHVVADLLQVQRGFPPRDGQSFKNELKQYCLYHYRRDEKSYDETNDGQTSGKAGLAWQQAWEELFNVANGSWTLPDDGTAPALQHFCQDASCCVGPDGAGYNRDVTLERMVSAIRNVLLARRPKKPVLSKWTKPAAQ